MSCDRGFGEIEHQYRDKEYIHTPDEYKTMGSKLKNASVKLLQPHKVLDLKALTDGKKVLYAQQGRNYTFFEV